MTAGVVAPEELLRFQVGGKPEAFAISDDGALGKARELWNSGSVDEDEPLLLGSPVHAVGLHTSQ